MQSEALEIATKKLTLQKEYEEIFGKIEMGSFKKR